MYLLIVRNNLEYNFIRIKNIKNDKFNLVVEILLKLIYLLINTYSI